MIRGFPMTVHHFLILDLLYAAKESGIEPVKESQILATEVQGIGIEARKFMVFNARMLASTELVDATDGDDFKITDKGVATLKDRYRDIVPTNNAISFIAALPAK